MLDFNDSIGLSLKLFNVCERQTRYEDLKICDRRYGSESFNIVPGTEYLLPQHLEDIARWIHPIEARPGLWADHRPQVRALMEYIKDYRHREVRPGLVDIIWKRIRTTSF